MSVEMNLYPAGFVEYIFKMYITYERPISCNVLHPDVRELILEKLNLSDEYDPNWRMTINTGPIPSIEEVDNIGNAVKNEVFDTLAFTLNTNISEITQTGHGLIPRPEEGGIMHAIMPMPTICMTAVVGCNQMSDNSAHEVQAALSKVTGIQCNPRISLFRHAIGIEEPILQFLLFYLIIYDLCENQKGVDQRIRSIAPDTAETEYAYIKNGKPQSISETTYTRLRNEVNHRANVSFDGARNEIINNLDRFRSIVYKILQSTELNSSSSS